MQEPVAEVVPEAVVDLLEAVQVHQHHGERRRVAVHVRLDLLERVGQVALEQRPDREIRERVVHRLVFLLAPLGLELEGRFVEPVGSREHLPGEQHGREGLEDRPVADPHERARDHH